MKTKAILGVIVIVALVCGCMKDDEGTRDALVKAGFTNITPLGLDIAGCDTFYTTRFRATNPQGIVMEGTVCCDILPKRCTIRF